MSAPTNISFATAYDLGSTLPVSYAERVDDSGTTYTVWFKFTPGVNGLGVWAFGDVTTYKPVLTFFTDATTQVFGTATNVPAQIPTTAGVPIYFKVTPNGGNPTPANLTMSVITAPVSTAVAGDLFINDSSDTYPALVMDSDTAAVKRFVTPFAAGEGVCVFQDGTIGAISVASSVNGPVIYNSDFTIKVTPTMSSNTGLTAFNDCLGTNQVDTFWAGSSGGGATHAKICSITSAGVVGSDIDLGSAGLGDLTPQADNSAIYFTKNKSSTNQAVFKVTNPGAVVTTFLSGVANYFFGANLMMMTDDTLLIPYRRTGSATLVKRYDLSANLLNTYTFAVDLDIERIFADPADPTYFWMWTQSGSLGSTFNSFTKVRVSDGATTTAGPVVQYITGVYQDAQTATPSARFGADFSCVPIVLRSAVSTSTGRRGIYVPTRGDAGSEGGGSNARFGDLNGYPSVSGGGFSATVGGRIIPILAGAEGRRAIAQAGGAGSGRAIYVPTVGIAGAEGDPKPSTLAALAIRRIVVYDGEGYTHR